MYNNNKISFDQYFGGCKLHSLIRPHYLPGYVSCCTDNIAS